LLTAIFARGHALLVGPPGVAKTLLVRTVADALGWSFKRIQFTPDLMPSDITGTEVLREDKSSGARSFAFVPGPVFANLVLADEINRTTPKTQAALLEAMQEGLVTAGGTTHALPKPFFVLATQNPIEQEGTYRLPEAQLDRFLVAIQVGYPDVQEERAIALLDTVERAQVAPVLEIERFTAIARGISAMPVPPVAVDYAVRLVRATRPEGDVQEWVRANIAWGCGPRATQHLIAAARARAALGGRAAVGCDDIATVAPWVLAHRLVPTFQALGKGTTPASLVATLLKQVTP
ncbi:MAG TPA: AAA family ATPase, partial [Planctomycetota bacterium]|nr:AAA family ATPase [Planctomycetota bacterium]